LKTEKIQKVLDEIEIIERIIKPYEFYTMDASRGLRLLATIKENLREPEKIDVDWILEKLKEGESLADQYRGYEPAEESRRHLAQIKRIIEEG